MSHRFIRLSQNSSLLALSHRVHSVPLWSKMGTVTSTNGSFFFKAGIALPHAGGRAANRPCLPGQAECKLTYGTV